VPAFFDVVKEMSGLADQATKAARRAARPVSCASATPPRGLSTPVVPGTIRAAYRAYPDVDLTLEDAKVERRLRAAADLRFAEQSQGPLLSPSSRRHRTTVTA
jgi:DNA-binding transcriptional LysR family regulator